MAVTVNALFKKSAPAPAKTVKKTVRFFFFSFKNRLRITHTHPSSSSFFILGYQEGGPGEEADAGEEADDGEEDGQEGGCPEQGGQVCRLVQVVR